jgi:hypothetical protein
VDTSFGFSDIIDLQAALEKRLSARRDTLILIAWEHKQIEALVKGLLDAHGGDPAVVPKWHGNDFDSIYVVMISRNGGAASFALKREGLDGQRRRVLTESQTRRHRFADVAAQAIPQKAHGTRDMPFWGDRYAPEPSKALIPRPSENVLSRFLDPEALMRMRILAVIDYLNRLQEK